MDHIVEVNKIFELVKQDMVELGVYEKQHDATILRYAQLDHMHSIQMMEFMDNGMESTIEYTNRGGETNVTKNPVVQSLERLRVDLLSLENVLGLNPSALAKILKVKGTPSDKPELSAFEKMMSNMPNDKVTPIRKANTN